MPTWLLIIIINGVVAVLFAFAAYIWRNLEGRVKGMEIDAKAYTDKLLEHPLLTADAHTAICSKTIGHVKEFVQGQSDHIVKQMADGETRTEGRVKGMEIDEKAYTDKLLEHPLLTADAHTAICSKTIGQVKEFVQGQSDHIIKQMADGETRTGLLIENAILKASQNGNGKKNGIRRKK